MLPSVAAKCFYRKLGRYSSEIKYFDILCFGGSTGISQSLGVRVVKNKVLSKFIYTSAYFGDKSKSFEAKELSNSEKDAHKIIKQSPTGDIIVKTETDSQKVVTKVTIEKSQPPVVNQAVSQPGQYN